MRRSGALAAFAFLLALVLAPRVAGEPAEPLAIPAAAELRTGPAAAAPAESLTVSLGECTERALREGEEIRLAEASHASARALYLQARSTALPQLTATGRYTRQFESIFRGDGGGLDVEPFEPDTLAPLEQRVRDLERALPTSGLAGLAGLFESTSFGSENTYVASLGVTQSIFKGGSIWHSISAAKHALGAVRNQRTDSEQAVILGVREAYLNALLAERSARIAALSLEQAETELERVRLRRDAGQASEFTLLQAEVERGNQVPIVKQTEAQRRIAQLELARLANLPPDVPLRLITPLLSDAAIPEEPAAVDTTGLVAAALQSAAVLSIEEELRAREHAITVAAAGKWPDVSLFANYSRQAFPSDLFPTSDDWRTDANGGVAVVWKLFDGFQTKGEIGQAKAQAMTVRQQLGQARELARESVIESRLELERSASELLARTRTVQVARRAHELSSLRHEEGAASLLEVNEARIAYQIAQANEARTRHAYFLALARLERYSGRPLFTSILERIELHGGVDR